MANSGQDESTSPELCLMNTLVGTADIIEDRIENMAFCEGHTQRGLNVCWDLKQYTPIGDLNEQEVYRPGSNFQLQILTERDKYYKGK